MLINPLGDGNKSSESNKIKKKKVKKKKIKFLINF